MSCRIDIKKVLGENVIMYRKNGRGIFFVRHARFFNFGR